MTKFPDLIKFDDYNSDWKLYTDELYHIYKSELYSNDFQYNGNIIYLKRHPKYDGKDKGFWHLITEGDIEEKRLPDLFRCERFKWIKFIIQNAQKDSEIKVWENTRRNKENICFAIKDFSYIVILSKRKTYFVLLTAYYIQQSYRREKLKKEFETYHNNP